MKEEKENINKIHKINKYIMIENNEQKGNYYIIADHLRTTIFALADGANIEPKGRGYILKKLIKRSCLLTHFLNLSFSDLLLISKKIIGVNSFFYIHLEDKESYIISSLEKEFKKEAEFIIRATEKMDKYLSKNQSKLIPAEEIFLWYDTHGIPLELIYYHLKRKGKEFSEKKFNELLEKQKSLGKKDREGKKIVVFISKDDEK